MVICDVLIIGSGIAGLSLAIKLSMQFPDRKILVVTKGDELDSNTVHAQGGISAVCDFKNDSFEKHIEDTLKAGHGLCNREVVEKVIRYGQDALRDLTENGVDFDRDNNRAFVLGQEGGHSCSRIVHYKDMSGFQIAVSLLLKVKTLPGITLLPSHTVIDLITSRLISPESKVEECHGALILNDKTKTVQKFLSRVTVLATGGIGQVYKTTTNPENATGDGIGIAHRAGASIRNMEFIQFHPTAFYSNQNESPNFLISEAIRGQGAFLRNCNGERFMFKYDSQGELACRDVVARSIENEIKTTGCCVYVDCRHLSRDDLMKCFPKIYSFCMKKDIDITTDLIPVIPAAHYLCGGISVDISARTSVNNLYAIGECSDTGLHGAKRLASNSLLEAVAFSEFCFQHIRRTIGSVAINSTAINCEFPYQVEKEKGAALSVLREKVQACMTKYVGIRRTTKGLQYALGYLELAEKRLTEYYLKCISTELLEFRNILITSKLVIVHSLNRKINIGAFYNVDLDGDHVFDLNRAR